MSHALVTLRPARTSGHRSGPARSGTVLRVRPFEVAKSPSLPEELVPRPATWLNRLRPRAPQGITSSQHGDQLRHPRSEILALTGIRAAAALAVVIHHIGLPTSAPEPLRNLAASGYIGVPLFFMLSGLVLTWNYSSLTLSSGT